MGKKEWLALLAAAVAGAAIGFLQDAGDWSPALLAAVSTAATAVIGIAWMAFGGGQRPPSRR